MDSQVEAPVCRFCLDSTALANDPFLQPCNCKGSVENVHYRCLLRWVYMSGRREPNEECNMCKSYYIYEIPTLEEGATTYNRLIVLLTTTPVVGLWFCAMAVGDAYICMSTQLLTAQTLIACYYFGTSLHQVKNRWRYVYYYFKHWSIHLLAVAAIFIIMARYNDGLVLLIYTYISSLVWYVTPRIDGTIRVRINKKVLAGLLEDRVGG